MDPLEDEGDNSNKAASHNWDQNTLTFPNSTNSSTLHTATPCPDKFDTGKTPSYTINHVYRHTTRKSTQKGKQETTQNPTDHFVKNKLEMQQPSLEAIYVCTKQPDRKWPGMGGLGYLSGMCRHSVSHMTERRRSPCLQLCYCVVSLPLCAWRSQHLRVKVSVDRSSAACASLYGHGVLGGTWLVSNLSCGPVLHSQLRQNLFSP